VDIKTVTQAMSDARQTATKKSIEQASPTGA